MPFFFPSPFGGGGENQGDPAPDNPPSEASQNSPFTSSGQPSDEPLPRSEEAGAAARSYGWDSEAPSGPMRDTEVMNDPWADNSDQVPGWGDLFGSDSDDGFDGDGE